MKMKKLLLALCVLMLVVTPVFSQGASESASGPATFKNDITMNVFVAVGGALDVRARVLAEYLTKELGVNVSVENIPGAGGITCATQMLSQPRSKYDLLFATAALFTTSPLFTETIYTIKDFTPLVAADVESFGLYTAPKRSGIKNFDDLKAYASKKELIYGSGGIGNLTHLTQAALYNKLGFKANTLAHNGAIIGITNAMGGHNMVTMSGIETARSYVESGDIVPIMTFNPEAYTGYKGLVVPSVLEVGGDEDNVYQSLMMVCSLASVDKPHEEALRNALLECYKNPSFIEDMKKVGFQYAPEMTTEEIVTYIEKEYKTIKTIIDIISQK